MRSLFGSMRAPRALHFSQTQQVSFTCAETRARNCTSRPSMLSFCLTLDRQSQGIGDALLITQIFHGQITAQPPNDTSTDRQAQACA